MFKIFFSLNVFLSASKITQAELINNNASSNQKITYRTLTLKTESSYSGLGFLKDKMVSFFLSTFCYCLNIVRTRKKSLGRSPLATRSINTESPNDDTTDHPFN